MIFPILLFLLGLVLLVKGADFLIEGAASLAKKFGVPAIVVGLTVVAFGTSAPELVVNVIASLAGSSELVVGNIVGSNIANLGLALGIAGLIAPLAIQPGLFKKEIPFGLFGAFLIFALASRSPESWVLSRGAGGLLVAGFAFFIFMIWRGMRGQKNPDLPEEAAADLPTWRALFFVLLGIAGLAVGGKLVVDNAIALASLLGVSEGLLGFTLVAIGTSAPEIVTSVQAVRRGQNDLAVGNAVGSNVFNIFWVLGVSSLVRPISFASTVAVDLLVLGGVTLVILATKFFSKKSQIERWQAALLILIYAVYTAYLIHRG